MQYRIEITTKFIEEGVTESIVEEATEILHIGKDRLLVSLLFHRLELMFMQMSTAMFSLEFKDN